DALVAIAGDGVGDQTADRIIGAGRAAGSYAEEGGRLRECDARSDDQHTGHGAQTFPQFHCVPFLKFSSTCWDWERDVNISVRLIPDHPVWGGDGHKKAPGENRELFRHLGEMDEDYSSSPSRSASGSKKSSGRSASS